MNLGTPMYTPTLPQLSLFSLSLSIDTSEPPPLPICPSVSASFGVCLAGQSVLNLPNQHLFSPGPHNYSPGSVIRVK